MSFKVSIKTYGDLVDRYGGTNPNSRFLAPENTPINQRSLPPNIDYNKYNCYEVLKSFHVQGGKIAPYYGKPGGGTQYVTPYPINELIERGYLIKIK